LTHNTKWLVEMIGHRVVIDFGEPAFLGANGGCEVSEVIDREREVCGQGFTDRLAVIKGFGERKHLKIGFDAISDLEQHCRTFGGGGTTPCPLGGVRGVEREFDIRRFGTGDLAVNLPRDGADVLEIFAAHWGNPLADEIFVPALEFDLGASGAGQRVLH